MQTNRSLRRMLLEAPRSHAFAVAALQLAALAATPQVTGCSAPTATERATSRAQQNGFLPAVIRGNEYRHQIFARGIGSGDLLYVFIDGDGMPWIRGGLTTARDPTPHRPLALEVAVQTPRAALYLGRPCYFSTNTDPGCSAEVWTSARYSERVVDSMAAAVDRFAAQTGYRRVVLIGYSGGGTLAVLMAPRIPSTIALITIAANLDVEAWTRWHGYLPLGGSLDPASQPPLDSAIRQWHLLGDRDSNVPAQVSHRYLDSISPDHIWRYAGFDHVCCWAEQWPAIFARIDRAIAN